MSKLLGKTSSLKNYSIKHNKRGKVLHNIRAHFLQEALKTGYRNKISYTIFCQRIREIYNKILAEIRSNNSINYFYRDANILLKALMKDITTKAKEIAKSNNWNLIPEKVETELFGGIISFEQEERIEIDGTIINARVDDFIELGSGKFIVREFKSYQLDGEIPDISDSVYYKDFVQVCLYGYILQETRGQVCSFIELVYYPNKVLRYEFSETQKNLALEYIRENSIEALDFRVVSKSEIHHEETNSISEENINNANKSHSKIKTLEIDDLSFGYINTAREKPLTLINGKPNKLEGYLYIGKAEFVKDGDLVAVERQDGLRIICLVEEIKCYQGNVSGETTVFGVEKIFKIKLNPIWELSLEGPREPRPQTIVQGKITKLTDPEFYQFKKIPYHGIPFGSLSELNQDYQYNFDPVLLYQGIFMGGTQGTGKTSALRFISLASVQQETAPAIVIYDAENEFTNLCTIPSSEQSKKTMEKYGLDTSHNHNIQQINLSEDGNQCLTLTYIDPLHLLLFMHELAPVSYSMLKRILQDIKNCYKNQEFTFPELRDHILTFISDPRYRLTTQVRDAIWRGLQSITLDMFDRPKTMPINVLEMFESGKITIINTYNLSDEQQRIVALYLLAVFHKYKIKRDTYNLGVFFIIDEVQRLLPSILSSSEHQKRIIHFLSETQHRGRKRNYGVIYATQHPKDMKKEIVDLCNTKIFFQIQGSGCEYIKEYLNKGQREQLKQLPEGYAFILSKGKHDPVVIKFPLIN